MKIISHEARRCSARNRLIVIAAAAAAIIASAAVLLTQHSSTPTSSTNAAPSATPNAPSPRTTVAPGAVTVLPKPDGVKDGVPVGYPHTEMGAISAAAHFFDVLDILSPDQAQKQAEVVADPTFSKVIGSEVRGASQTVRRAAGLPVDGEAGPGTYMTSQSRAFQTPSTSPDRVVVWLLCDTQSSLNGITKSGDQVNGAVMVWAGGDWKVSVDDAPGPKPASATPGSSQADQEGWQSLAYAT